MQINAGIKLFTRPLYRRRMLKNMPFPAAIPEIPVGNVDKAAEYYGTALGFTFDWGNDDGGIGQISQGDCRIFLTNHRAGNVVVWLNLNSRQEVDDLYERWRKAGAQVEAPPEDKPWNLREFTALDPDGNRLRVFYDFAWESRNDRPGLTPSQNSADAT